jgi:hypothetical protein
MFLRKLVKLFSVKLQEKSFNWFRVDERGRGKNTVEVHFCKPSLRKTHKNRH